MGRIKRVIPKQFLLVSILEYDEVVQKIVKRVALIRTVADEEANRQFFILKRESWCTYILPIKFLSFIFD